MLVFVFMSISHSNDNAMRRKGNEKKSQWIVCHLLLCFFVETPHCDVCTNCVGCRDVACRVCTIHLRAPSVAKIVGYHHHGMVLKNISFLFAFSQNEHTFMTAHLGSDCANERETTLAPTAEKSGDII